VTCKPETGEWQEGYEVGYADGEDSGDTTAWCTVSEALDMYEEWPELLKEIKRLKELAAMYEEAL